VDLWLAPPHGLFLDRVTFEAYNKKRDIPEQIVFNESEEKDIVEFKQNIIYPAILNAEKKR